MEKTVAAFEVRRQFGRLIEEAFYQKDSFVSLQAYGGISIVPPRRFLELLGAAAEP
jgi:hypothetical protein